MTTENPDNSLEEQSCILRAKREWEQTFDAVSDLIYIVDNNYTILRVNRAMAEHCALSPHELVGRKCFELLHGTSCAPDDCPHVRMLANATPQTSQSADIYFNGSLEVTTSPLFDGEGNITASVHVARDVTEKRRHDDTVAIYQRQLEEINRSLETRINEAVTELRKKDDILIQQSRLTAIGEMLSSIAHQWRQPLNNIGLIVQNLQLAYKANDLTVEEMDAEAAETMKTLQQMSETIDDFRNYFSYDSEISSFVVNEAISRTLSFIEPELKRKGIRVVFNEEAEVVAVGYPNEYTQAVLNILLNARDALLEQQRSDPLIDIRLFGENGTSVVTVTDNGGGIAEDIMAKIFDPYFSTKKQNTGAGIGLYMAKMIIEKKMGGRLTARNVDGGAEFRIEV